MMSVNNSARVLVLMSGGVDSSVAAALLKEQGYSVTGIMMQIWGGAPASGISLHHGCYGPEEFEDIEDARRVAGALDIPFQLIDLREEYQNTVLDYFSQEYSCGRTPNPCVRCNHRIKFGALIEKARSLGLGFDFMASGHYARVESGGDRYLLKKARDLSKDQSYFLAFLDQGQLSRLIFPLGELTKVEVRRIAARFGLPVARKPDSQNFISGDYTDVISTQSPPGPILDREGRVLGRHRGIQHYTLGQRKGLGIASPNPLYVTALDPLANTITAGEKASIYQNKCVVGSLNWLAVSCTEGSLTAGVKVRSSHREAPAEITPLDSLRVAVHFREPQLALTPGQAAVFYREDVVLGGGIIEQVIR
jgi:tRNA-uridine 2-sulfurtransferase